MTFFVRSRKRYKAINMGKVTDLTITAFVDDIKRERVSFTTPVSVRKDGVFTTTLPKEAVTILESYGVKLDINRLGNPGYFENETLAGLEKELNKVLKDALTRELVEDKLVIKYHVDSWCLFAKDLDGEIIPNGYWSKEKQTKELQWIKGSSVWSTEGFVPGIKLYCKVYHKKIYQFKSGKTYCTYEYYFPKQGRGTGADWINSQVQIGYSGRNIYNLKEVDANDNTLSLFVKALKFINKTCELFSNFTDTDKILALSNRNLLPEIIFNNKDK